MEANTLQNNYFSGTVEPVLKDRPYGHKKYGLSRQVAFSDRFIYTEIEELLPQKILVLQDRWSLMAVVSQDRFYCNKFY